MNLYVTSDKIGSQTGGGVVTFNELEALKKLDSVQVINPNPQQNPFDTDFDAFKMYRTHRFQPKIAHFYAGTYSRIIETLKKDNVRVTYTAAAHDIDLSREEFESLGFSFSLPHLTDPKLLERYLAGYQDADIVVCPSQHSKQIMTEKFGCKNIIVIPHGCCLPSVVKPISKRFVVGYLGQPGPDKGLQYLIKAWASLDYKDALLVIAGRGTEELLPLVRKTGKGSIRLAGFVKSTSDFYNSCSVYVQPSVTEGFGIEILEAMAHGRPVIASEGAGAADCLTPQCGKVVARRNPEAIAEAIEDYKKNIDKMRAHGENGKIQVMEYTWDKISKKYQLLWANI